MPRWEYCHIYWVAIRTSEDSLNKLSTVERQSLNITKTAGMILAQGGSLHFYDSQEDERLIHNLGENLAQLGRDGWELISHSFISIPVPHEMFYFKRQLPE